MKFTSSVREQHQSDGTQDSSSGRLHSFSGIFGEFVLAAVLALAPLPTFAQHGGGGGGAHGGGGGGGAHAGGGGSSAGHSSGGGHAASAPSGAGASAGAGNTSSGGGHWWNPFHGGGSNSTTGATGAKGTTAGAATGSTTDRFAANNNTWQAPPAGASGAAVRHSGTPVASAPRTAIASPPHVPVPRHRIGYGGYYPGYPFYPGYGFGFGFGGLGYGFYGPCDPFWGCYGYGSGFYGGGAGYGYYGGSFSGYSGLDLSYSAADDAGSSQEPNPSLYAQAPETTDGSGGVTAGPAGKHVVAILYLKDGSSYAVTDYWLEGGKLHYVASYGGENAIDESALDLQRTVNENAAQGLTFTLRPSPEATPAVESAPVAPTPEAPKQ
jgi:hypothetical protein